MPATNVVLLLPILVASRKLPVTTDTLSLLETSLQGKGKLLYEVYLSPVLDCDNTRRAFQNTREM